MIENLIAAWLTDASERSYEAAFAQLLVIEGHNVVQGPMHHAHEHGKDIIAFGPGGELCAYQLKGGRGSLDIPGFDQLHHQLFAATSGIVDHPSLPVARVPDRVYLVTNQAVTGPMQGRIRNLSGGWTARGLSSLHLIERDELLSRFVRAGGRFFPSSPSALRAFLTLFLSDGLGTLPIAELLRLLESILPLHGRRVRAGEAQRSISAGALTFAFALRPWIDTQNHAEVALGWFYFCSQVLRCAQRLSLGGARWEAAYRLGLEEGRRHTRLLLHEALSSKDLVTGHPADPLLYPLRVVKTGGLISALLISDRIAGRREDTLAREVRTLLVRELSYVKIVTESQAPYYFMMVLALSATGEAGLATQRLFSWLRSVAQANHPDSSSPLPSPYHSPEDALVMRLPFLGDRVSDDEQFAGRSYTLHLAVRWVARRLWRQSLASIWHEISRVEACSFEPESSADYFGMRSPRGTLRTSRYPQPTSWAALLASVNELDFARLPGRLVENAEFVPFFCLAFPHRFTQDVADYLDHIAT